MSTFFSKEPLYHYPMDRWFIKSRLIYESSNIIVHIGGGPNRNHPKEINLNIVHMPNVDIIADSECLPFKSGSIGVIISNAVLEHIKNLDKAVTEIMRVLKPGGLLYIEVPFIQHYHTRDAYGIKFEDYRRLTKTGVSCIFSDFCVPIDVGVCVGPTSAVLQIIFTYFDDLHSNILYKKIIKLLYYFLGNILSRIDNILPRSVIERSRIPSGVYYLGRKVND